MKRTNQKGVALIFTLIFILVLSVTAATLMFLSQSETWSSMNYRLMTQSRYGAEAGLHAAANYMINNYTLPGGPGDPLSAYNYKTVSPVTLAGGGSPIALGVTMNGISSNYPVGTVLTNFNTASQGSLTGGNNTVNYSVSAELLSMRSINQCYGNGQPLTAQLWRLTSHGDITGTRSAEVEVSALLELHVTPCFLYAGFATGNGCGSINFNSGGTIDSYNSSNMTLSGGSPVTQNYQGDLGSNGNVNTSNGTTINGTFSSPDTGVGACGGGGGVDALTGGGTVTGCAMSTTSCLPAPGLVKLPQPMTFVPPATDYPGCTGAGAAVCDAALDTTLPAPNNLVPVPGPPIGPGLYGDISAAGNQVVTFNPAGTTPADCAAAIYYVNSISLKGNASLTIAPCPGTGPGSNPPLPAAYMPVIINIVGSGGGTVLDAGGNGIANPGFNSSLIQIQYGGAGLINLHGNGATAAVIYAPNATVNLKGNGTVYGSVIGAQINGIGGPVTIHYDRALSANLVTVGNWTLDTFTWSKY